MQSNSNGKFEGKKTDEQDEHARVSTETNAIEEERKKGAEKHAQFANAFHSHSCVLVEAIDSTLEKRILGRDKSIAAKWRDSVATIANNEEDVNEEDLPFSIKKTCAMLNKVMTCEGIWQETLKSKFEEADANMLKSHHKSQVDRAKLDVEKFSQKHTKRN